MAIYVNGSKVTGVVKRNGVVLDKVKANGVTVWENYHTIRLAAGYETGGIGDARGYQYAGIGSPSPYPNVVTLNGVAKWLSVFKVIDSLVGYNFLVQFKEAGNFINDVSDEGVKELELSIGGATIKLAPSNSQNVCRWQSGNYDQTYGTNQQAALINVWNYMQIYEGRYANYYWRPLR